MRGPIRHRRSLLRSSPTSAWPEKLAPMVKPASPGRRRPTEEEVRARSQALWEASEIRELHIKAHWRKIREYEEYYDSITRKFVPAAKKAIIGLYKPTWSETREEHGCAICLEDLETHQKFRMMPCCHHSFHEPCIFEWVLMNRICPICQSPLPSEEEQRQLDEQATHAQYREDPDGETDELVIVD